MNEFSSLGEAWIWLLSAILRDGRPMHKEGLELLCASVAFPAVADGDPILERFGDVAMMAEMKTVFFGDDVGRLGHSYAKLMRGPAGRNDLEDIIALLRAEPWSKRAVLTLCGLPDGKVPCINAVQFLWRGNLNTVYFARGQDAFRKLYADALCIGDMARRVAAGLGVATGTITAFIGSCHFYHEDRPAIERLLRQAKRSPRRRGGDKHAMPRRPVISQPRADRRRRGVS
jgi:hypothetical protein